MSPAAVNEIAQWAVLGFLLIACINLRRCLITVLKILEKLTDG